MVGCGIALIVLGANVDSMVTNWNIGIWWAGMVMLIAAAIGFCVKNKGTASSSSVCASVATIVVIVAAILAGIFYAVIENLVTCFDQDDNKYYGDSSYDIWAHSCSVSHSEQCACVADSNQDDDSIDCYMFDMGDGNNCGDILNSWTHLLEASAIMGGICVAITLAFAILSCILACSSELNPAPPTATAEPQVVQPTVTVLAEPVVVNNTMHSGANKL